MQYGFDFIQLPEFHFDPHSLSNVSVHPDLSQIPQYWPITNGNNDCFFTALAAYMYFSIDGNDCSQKLADIVKSYTLGPTLEDIQRQLKELELLRTISETAFSKMETCPAECDDKIHQCASEFKKLRKMDVHSMIDAEFLGERKDYSYYSGYYSKFQHYNPDQLYLQLVHRYGHFYCLVIYDGLCYKIDSLNCNFTVRAVCDLDDNEIIVLSTLYNRFDTKRDLMKYSSKYIVPIMNKVKRYSCVSN